MNNVKQYVVSFSVPGQPQAKQRARKGGQGHWYNPQVDEMKRFSNQIRDQFAFEMIPAGIPVKCIIRAFFEIPKSKKITGEETPALNKKDIDNIEKFITDSMNGIVYYDDNQIYSMSAEKFYSKNPRTEVTIIWEAGKPQK